MEKMQFYRYIHLEVNDYDSMVKQEFNHPEVTLQIGMHHSSKDEFLPVFTSHPRFCGGYKDIGGRLQNRGEVRRAGR